MGIIRSFEEELPTNASMPQSMDGSREDFKDKDPKQAIQDILQHLETDGVEAHFVNNVSGDSIISPEDIEVSLANYAQEIQDDTEFHKWQKIDSTIKVALNSYRMSLRVLLSGIVGKDQARQAISSANPDIGQKDAELGQQELPTSREEGGL